MIKIYSLHHPITGELRYIGKTNENYITTRLTAHIKDSFRRNHINAQWIKSLLKEGLVPEITLIDEVEEDNWQFWEIFYISYFKSIGCRLNNMTTGGDSSPAIKGRKLSEEHRAKIAIISRRPRINKQNFGVKRKVPILQYTIEGTLIKEHLSALDAYNETGIWKESIRNCCNNRSKSAGGYYWIYKNKPI